MPGVSASRAANKPTNSILHQASHAQHPSIPTRFIPPCSLTSSPIPAHLQQQLSAAGTHLPDYIHYFIRCFKRVLVWNTKFQKTCSQHLRRPGGFQYKVKTWREGSIPFLHSSPGRKAPDKLFRAPGFISHTSVVWFGAVKHTSRYRAWRSFAEVNTNPFLPCFQV